MSASSCCTSPASAVPRVAAAGHDPPGPCWRPSCLTAFRVRDRDGSCIRPDTPQGDQRRGFDAAIGRPALGADHHGDALRSIGTIRLSEDDGEPPISQRLGAASAQHRFPTRSGLDAVHRFPHQAQQLHRFAATCQRIRDQRRHVAALDDLQRQDAAGFVVDPLDALLQRAHWDRPFGLSELQYALASSADR